MRLPPGARAPARLWPAGGGIRFNPRLQPPIIACRIPLAGHVGRSDTAMTLSPRR